MKMPIRPIKLNHEPLLIRSGRSAWPSEVSPMKPRGSTCLPNGSSIGLPCGSTFLERSGRGEGSSFFTGSAAIVTTHQTIITTPITVVASMILSARSLDSWIPLVLTRQK